MAYYLLLVGLSRLLLLLLLYLQEHMPHDIDDFFIEPPFEGMSYCYVCLTKGSI